MGDIEAQLASNVWYRNRPSTMIGIREANMKKEEGQPEQEEEQLAKAFRES